MSSLLGRLTVLTVLVSGICLAVACELGKPPFAASPYFLHANLTLEFSCYPDNAETPETLTVSSMDNGRTARLQFNGRTAVLDFQPGTFGEDRYRRGDVEMTLDPEAHVTGLIGDNAEVCTQSIRPD